jgi:hypothetical protein
MGLESEMLSTSEQKELQRIRREAHKKRAATLESTREMVHLFQECEDAGISTWINLKQQDGKLKRVENKLDRTHSVLEETDKTLTKIEKGERCCCCCSFCPTCKSKCRKPKEKHPNLWRPVAPPKKAWNSDSQRFTRLKPTDARPVSKQPDKEDSRPPKDSVGTETEIDQNMDLVSSMVKNLKRIALEVGDELTVGNERLDRLNLKTASNAQKVHSMSKRVKVLL